MRRTLPLVTAISLVLLGLGGCGASQSAQNPSAATCPTQAAVQKAAKSGVELQTTLQGAQCIAAFPVRAPGWVPAGSHLLLVDVAFAKSAGAGKPQVREVDLFYTPDSHQHSFYVFERVGSAAPPAGSQALQVAGHPAQELVMPPTLAQNYPLAEITLPLGSETYLIQGGVRLQTAKRIATSLAAP